MSTSGQTRSHLLPLCALAILLTLQTLLLVTAARAGEDPIFPPGSRIGLAPPSGFVASPDFAGFMDREAVSSIMISGIPKEAYDEISVGMTKEQLAAQGMTLLGSCDNVNTVFESRCYRVTQEANGYLFQKWFLLARVAEETAMVVATVPDVVIADGRYSVAAIEAALSSLAYSDGLASDPIDALPFTIEEGDLLPFRQMLGGSAAGFGGEATAEGPAPLWVVAASLDTNAAFRNISFSHKAFQDIAFLSEPQVTTEQPISLDALSGHLLEGTGKDAESGHNLYAFQAILVDADDKYYRMVGIAPVQQKDIYRPEFLRLMKTLRPK